MFNRIRRTVCALFGHQLLLINAKMTGESLATTSLVRSWVYVDTFRCTRCGAVVEQSYVKAS